MWPTKRQVYLQKDAVKSNPGSALLSKYPIPSVDINNYQDIRCTALLRESRLVKVCCGGTSFGPKVEDDFIDRQEGHCVSSGKFNNRTTYLNALQGQAPLRYSKCCFENLECEAFLVNLGACLELSGEDCKLTANAPKKRLNQ